MAPAVTLVPPARPGREKLLRYVLRPPIAQERVEHRPDGLVRITLKRAYADGTLAVDMDPLSLLCRLATAVPARGPSPASDPGFFDLRSAPFRI